jgi:hypothetical protein
VPVPRRLRRTHAPGGRAAAPRAAPRPERRLGHVLLPLPLPLPAAPTPPAAVLVVVGEEARLLMLVLLLMMLLLLPPSFPRRRGGGDAAHRVLHRHPRRQLLLPTAAPPGAAGGRRGRGGGVALIGCWGRRRRKVQIINIWYLQFGACTHACRKQNGAPMARRVRTRTWITAALESAARDAAARVAIPLPLAPLNRLPPPAACAAAVTAAAIRLSPCKGVPNLCVLVWDAQRGASVSASSSGQWGLGSEQGQSSNGRAGPSLIKIDLIRPAG